MFVVSKKLLIFAISFWGGDFGGKRGGRIARMVIYEQTRVKRRQAILEASYFTHCSLLIAHLYYPFVTCSLFICTVVSDNFFRGFATL
jgi:hypothetical protein